MSTLRVKTTGGDYNLTQLQNAIDAAVAGDIITIEAGATCTGSFILRNKGVLSSFITIQSESLTSLPPPGVRINPSYRAFMPTIQSIGGGAPAMECEKSANHYRLLGLTFAPSPLGIYTVLCLGTGNGDEAFRSELVDYMEVDRCYLYHDPVFGMRRQIQLNAKHATIKNSYITVNTPESNDDSQCISGWNGAGPYLVDNNYLEGGTEPWIFGGSDPPIHVFMTVTASTTTTANVTVTNAGHTLAELALGDLVAFEINGGNHQAFGILTYISSTGTSGTLNFTGVTTAPDVGGTARAGIVLGDRLTGIGTDKGLIFTNNHVLWKASDRTTPIIGSSTVVSAPGATTGGSLSAGTYYASFVAINTGGYVNTVMKAAPSPEIPGVVPSGITGKITFNWGNPSNNNKTRVYIGTSPGVYTGYLETTGLQTTIDYTGQALTPASGTPNPDYWRHKNLGELKAAAHVLVQGNIFENHWATNVGSAQATWWKSTNQEGTATFVWTHDVLVQLNWFRHIHGWMEIHGQESFSPPPLPYGARNPAPLSDFTAKNNLVSDSGVNWGYDTYAMQIDTAATRATIDHNTIDHACAPVSPGGGLLTVDSTGPLLVTFVMTNNMGRLEGFGIHDSAGTGTAALDAAAPGWVFSKNGIADGYAAYPTGNFYEALATWKTEFVDYQADGSGDYRLKVTSAYHNAGLDGKDLGADIDAVLAATAYAISGDPGAPGTQVAVVDPRERFPRIKSKLRLRS